MGISVPKLAMSDNYAAIISSVIAAVIVVGFIEMHALMKWAMKRGDAIYLEQEEATALAVLGMREGVGPTPEQLSYLNRVNTILSQRKRFFRMAIPVALWWIWTLLCIGLVATLLEVLLWTATDNRGKSPGLTLGSLIFSSLGVMALLVAALGRALSHFGTEVITSNTGVDITSYEEREIYSRLDAFRADRGLLPWQRWSPFGLRWFMRWMENR
ncbi:hypothetical protein [Streptomyces sp. NPDC005262]|uniref:hypothetical protein n=1 Tax=Streptomyces sp. NPDC005262 TaxID=3364710 RepID=UPI00369A4A00